MTLTRMLAAALLAGAAHAQIPPVSVPGTPIRTAPLPGGLPRATGDLADGAVNGTDRALRRLAGARALRVESLARENPQVLERDPAGELAIRAEVIAIDISEPALRRALEHDFLLKRTRELPELGVKISVLQTPEGWTVRRGLKQLRKLDPEGTYDYNHVYLDGGDVNVPSPGGASTPVARATGRVGLIDGGVDAGHQVFRDLRLRHFGCEGKVVPSIHGTAVAAILAAQVGVEDIFAADVYCGAPAGGAIDAVTASFGWLARENVGVINISLVGPRNALLERVVSTLVARGHLIVAAVGNDGPSAPPLYPASYPGVVGVTAVDGNHRVLVEACRGEQVDFAARGAGVTVATQAPDVFAPVRGTSFAAPIVAGLLAADLGAPDSAARDRAIANWTRVAQDLGKRGRDDVYGAGELGEVREAVAGKGNE
jgi:subtilisin family serine protease